ncbi:hypothetical protein GQ457_09G019860 [Hibiscus cannabinus]
MIAWIVTSCNLGDNDILLDVTHCLTRVAAHPISKGLCDFLLLRERSFRDFCSLVYSGGMSRDLDVISVEIKDSSAPCHQEIKNRRIRKTGYPKVAQERGGTRSWAIITLAYRASFLHVEPFRLKLGFLVLPFAWDEPP